MIFKRTTPYSVEPTPNPGPDLDPRILEQATQSFKHTILFNELSPNTRIPDATQPLKRAPLFFEPILSPGPVLDNTTIEKATQSIEHTLFGIEPTLDSSLRSDTDTLEEITEFFERTPSLVEPTPDPSHVSDATTLEEATHSLKESAWKFQSLSSALDRSSSPTTPESRFRCASFDTLFSAILYKFLDGSIKQIRDGDRITDDDLATICAAIASSPLDSQVLIYAALRTIPASIKEAFGCAPWSWEAVRYEDTSQTDVSPATGVYAYHLTNINDGEEQDLYVGQTTRSFAMRWDEHDRYRRDTKSPKIPLWIFYARLKDIPPKDTHIFILADIGIFQGHTQAHKTIATLLEAAFVVFFDSYDYGSAMNFTGITPFPRL